MMYKNHLLVTSAIAVPIMSATGTLTTSSLLAVGFGALLPDIDEPESFIGRRTRVVSDLINLIFGHRGITHTLIFVVISSLLFSCLGSKIGQSEIGLYCSLGVFLHVLEDSFSNGGVEWLNPVSDIKYRVPLYTTGSIVEYLIGFVALIFLVASFRSGTFVLQKDSIFNTENLQSLIQKGQVWVTEVIRQ